MKPKTAAQIVKKIEACKKRIAVERDKLRELLDEANAIAEDCGEALDDLDRAADALSRYL